MINLFATKTELKILAVLSNGAPYYGLQIATIAGLKRGTVYTTLQRMQDRGLVRSKVNRKSGHPGMPRPLYSLTEAGERMLKAWDTVNQ